MSVKRVTSKKPYRLIQDDDAHWYLIPQDLRGEFESWLSDHRTYSYQEFEILQRRPEYINFDECRINGPHTLKIYSWADETNS